MGTIKKKSKEFFGSVRKPKTRNEIWTFQSTKSGIKKFYPKKRDHE